MKNQLSRIVASALLILCLFQSCSKEKDTQYDIRIRVDGVWRTFGKAGFTFEETGDPDKVFLTVAGRSADQKEAFILGVLVPKNPQPGTFDSENDMLELGYGINGSPSKYYTMWPVTDKPEPNFTVTITSISETEVRGHFTGNYLADEEENFIEVDEGQFVAKLTE